MDISLFQVLPGQWTTDGLEPTGAEGQLWSLSLSGRRHGGQTPYDPVTSGQSGFWTLGPELLVCVKHWGTHKRH